MANPQCKIEQRTKAILPCSIALDLAANVADDAAKSRAQEFELPPSAQVPLTVAHLADPGCRHMAEDVPIKMNHAALPLSVGQILRGTFHQASAGVGDDELHAVEAAVDEVAQECRPPGLVLLGALADAQNLPKTLRIDGAGHQQRDIADFASPGPLHHDAIEIKVRMFATK